MKTSLRTKILFSVGLIIFIVLGTSTFVHIEDLRRDYLEALEWRSEALAQGISNEIVEWYDKYQFDVAEILKTTTSTSLECTNLYESTKEKHVTHVAVIDTSSVIGAHNDSELWQTPVESPVLLAQLERRKLTTVLDGTVYHTLIPMFGKEGVYLGAVGIGVSKSVVDEKVKEALIQSAALLGLFLFLSFFTVSFLMHALLTKPVRQLVTVGQELAEGNLVQTPQATGRGDEIVLLGTAFNRISAYLQNVAEVASHIATGILDGEMHVRSKHDILGKAVQEMLHYLKHVASVATKVAEGDLTETVQVRSATDAFGRVIQVMTEGLRTLIAQIRTSAEQIVSTGSTISSLATQDIEIVQNVTTSAENMVSTMNEMGASIEEVAHNVDALSSSMEESSTSVSQMTSSIARIASKTTALTNQTHQAIESLNDALRSLEEIVKSTDTSRQLSQETIKDAFEGQRAVEQVMTSMETIHQTVTTAVDTITRFEQRSRDIDTILEVIREITEQTSLLALNASIIAAQAGVHGRGFAVVADEIKNLASGVGKSTKDIAVIVQTLQQDTNQVVQTIHEGAADVKQGMEHTQQARETLEKILSSAQRSSTVVTEIADTLHGLMTTSRNVSAAMEQVNMMMDDITKATNEQKVTTAQINQAIAHVNDMVLQIQQATTEQLTGVRQLLDTTNKVTNLIDQNLESSQQIAHTIVDLSSQADILLHSVDRFKLKT